MWGHRRQSRPARVVGDAPEAAASMKSGLLRANVRDEVASSQQRGTERDGDGQVAAVRRGRCGACGEKVEDGNAGGRGTAMGEALDGWRRRPGRERERSVAMGAMGAMGAWGA